MKVRLHHDKRAPSYEANSRFVVSSILVILLGLYLLWDTFLR